MGTRKYGFVHVPKTGGTNIRYLITHTGADKECRTQGHAYAIEMDAAWKFAFVRHPLDRALSWYFHANKGEIKNRGMVPTRHTVSAWILSPAFEKNLVIAPHRSVRDILTHPGDRNRVIVDQVYRFEEWDRAIEDLVTRGVLPPEAIEMARERRNASPRPEGAHWHLLSWRAVQRIRELSWWEWDRWYL